jgi:hypothetical protein
LKDSEVKTTLVKNLLPSQNHYLLSYSSTLLSASNLASFMQNAHYLLFSFSLPPFPHFSSRKSFSPSSSHLIVGLPAFLLALKRSVTLVGPTLITCPQPPHHVTFNIRYKIRVVYISLSSWLGGIPPNPLLSYWPIQLPQKNVFSSHAFGILLSFSAMDHVPHPYSTSGFNFLKT